MITCPKKVKLFPVSFIANPVTLTALVAVKAASTQVIPAVVALGNFNNKVPATIRKRKLPANTMDGLMLFFAYNLSLNNPISIERRKITLVINREEALLMDSEKLNP